MDSHKASNLEKLYWNLIWDMDKHNAYLCVSVAITLTVVLLLPSFESPSNAADRNWRFEAHGRNIDIDICIKCDSHIPGPPGPQGPPGEEGPPGPPGPVEPIGTDNIEDGAVTNPKLADDAVTTDKIVDGTITGSKIQGVDKLIFVECGIFDHPITLEPSRSMVGVCDAPGIEVGDRVVATLNPIQPTQYGCFGVVDSHVRETGDGLRVYTTINNECDFKATESFTIGIIIYQTI